MPEENKKNIFQEMEEQNTEVDETVEQRVETGEIDYDKLSDVPVGLEGKYNRPNLEGKEVKILSAKLYGATKDDEEIEAVNGSGVKYKKARFIITYDSKNADGVNDREYYSGVLQFVQKDNTLSMPTFWREGAENQAAQLWEKVAQFKKKDPKEMSKKEFVAFLNSGIKVKLKQMKAAFPGKAAVMKNLIDQIIG